METKETLAGKYENQYGIFTQKVDIKVLHDVILYDFMPYLKQKNLWFAVWCVLRDNNCLESEVRPSDFAKQMMDWFGKTFSKNCLDAYAATILSFTQWAQWNDKFLEKFKKKHGKALDKGRISINTVEKIYYLCEQFTPIILEKCIKRNIHS